MSKVAISFKGGLALGFGGFGVIKFLREHNLQPSIVAGSSAGAIVAAAYASGISDERILKKLQGFRFYQLFSIRSLRETSSITDEEELSRLILEMANGEDINIEDLPQRLVIFATDPVTAKRVFIEKGSLVEALQASIGYPGIFPGSVVKSAGGAKLVDGDLTMSYSADYLRSNGVEKVIGVRFEHRQVDYSKPNFLRQATLGLNITSRAIENINNEIAPVDLELQYKVSHNNYFSFAEVMTSVNNAYQACVERRKAILELF